MRSRIQNRGRRGRICGLSHIADRATPRARTEILDHHGDSCRTLRPPQRHPVAPRGHHPVHGFRAVQDERLVVTGKHPDRDAKRSPAALLRTSSERLGGLNLRSSADRGMRKDRSAVMTQPAESDARCECAGVECDPEAERLSRDTRTRSA